MQKIKYLALLSLLLPTTALASHWMDLWRTPDQQGTQLLQKGQSDAAAKVFKDKNWQAVSHYRSGDYEHAFNKFSANKSSDGQYNAGNAAAFMGKYQEAIAAYDKAIALNANNADAVTNREIIKKLLQQQQNNHASSPQPSPPTKNVGGEGEKQASNQKGEEQTSSSQSSSTSKQQPQDENNNQLLRRLSDDPGGLLQHKFLRDYARRHHVEDNSDQGVNS